MSQWSERILGHFTADLSRLWVACDPDDVLLDEKLLSELRSRGFEVMLYEDPFAFRAEYEERYRAAWDRGEQGPATSLILHVRSADANELPWDFLHQARVVRLSLAELFPKLAYSAVRQVEPEYLAGLFHDHQTELQSVRGENESKDFILEHVYQLAPRSIRTQVDFWRELLRLHIAGRSLPRPFALHVAGIIQGKGLLIEMPLVTWLESKSAVLRVVQDAWRNYLATLGMVSAGIEESPPSDYVAKVEVPFDHTDVQFQVDSLFLDGTLRPLAVHSLPSTMPSWIKAGVFQDPAALHALVLKGFHGLTEVVPTEASSYKDWSEFAKRYSELLARANGLSGEDSPDLHAGLVSQVKAIQELSDRRLQDWVKHGGFANAVSQPAVHEPAVLYRVPDYLRMRRGKGEKKIALLVFDGLALDQWVTVRDCLASRTKRFAFDEKTSFAWLPTVTAVSRQALFSGKRPREFEDSIGGTGKEERLWREFWQGVEGPPSKVMYRKALRHIGDLESLETELLSRQPEIVGLVINEVDDRIHKERSKRDVAACIEAWVKTGFVDRLFAMLLDTGYHVYLTADHGNVEAIGCGQPKEGVIADERHERVRIYRSEDLLASSAASYPSTLRIEVAGLPSNFLPLFAGGRTAFVTEGEQVVVHGGISIEELVVPFVKIGYSGNTA